MTEVFYGTPCRHHPHSPRYRSNHGCVECSVERMRKLRQDPEYLKEFNARRRRRRLAARLASQEAKK